MTKLTALLFAPLALTACADSFDASSTSEDLGATARSSTNSLLERAARKPACTPHALTADAGWYRDNAATLSAEIASAGCASEDYNVHKKPVALLDWDNTISKNDFGDAITFHMIAHDKVLQPPNQDWKQTSRFMTDAGAAALAAACGTDVPAGQPLPTSTNLGCADEMLAMYIDNRTRGGAVAFAGQDFRRIEPTYAWTAQLAAGYTHAEYAQMTLDAVLPQLAAPQGTTQTVGTRTGLNGWLRIYDQIKDLIGVLDSNGYDVWIITASPQDVIGAVAPLAGIPTSKVVGIRSLTDADGKLTSHFEGCGPIADGEDGIMSYIEGKRCWVNKVVFGDTSVRAIEPREPEQRQVFAAGDSDTDSDFVHDARFRLVLNRQKKELMCYAYYNAGGGWLVNPMFIEPKSAKTTPYPCSTTACIGRDGAGVPCLDDNGNVIPDQLDLVHP